MSSTQVAERLDASQYPADGDTASDVIQMRRRPLLSRPAELEAPPVSTVRPIPFALRVPKNVPGFTFEWWQGNQPGRVLKGLTAPEALDAFRHAWRTCNGTDWGWRVTFHDDEFDVLNDADEFVEGLDDLSRGTIADLTVHMRQAS